MYSQDTRSQVISASVTFYHTHHLASSVDYLGASAVLNNLLVVISSVIRYCRYCAHAELFE